MEVKIKQQHIKHSTWGQCVTVTKDDGKARKFSLRSLESGEFVIRTWRGSEPWSKPFATEAKAIDGCKRRMRK